MVKAPTRRPLVTPLRLYRRQHQVLTTPPRRPQVLTTPPPVNHPGRQRRVLRQRRHRVLRSRTELFLEDSNESRFKTPPNSPREKVACPRQEEEHKNAKRAGRRASERS